MALDVTTVLLIKDILRPGCENTSYVLRGRDIDRGHLPACNMSNASGVTQYGYLMSAPILAAQF